MLTTLIIRLSISPTRQKTPLPEQTSTLAAPDRCSAQEQQWCLKHDAEFDHCTRRRKGTRDSDRTPGFEASYTVSSVEKRQHYLRRISLLESPKNTCRCQSLVDDRATMFRPPLSVQYSIFCDGSSTTSCNRTIVVKATSRVLRVPSKSKRKM